MSDVVRSWVDEQKLGIRVYTQLSIGQYERVMEFSRRTKTPVATLLREGGLKLMAEKERERV